MVHGSPLNEDEYLINVVEAEEAFAYQPAQIVFFGHTHLQGGFEYQRKTTRRIAPARSLAVLELESGSAYLINPGSVGQPRDENPEAAFVIFDSDEQTVVYHRTPYDVGKAQAKIRGLACRGAGGSVGGGAVEGYAVLLVGCALIRHEVKKSFACANGSVGHCYETFQAFEVFLVAKNDKVIAGGDGCLGWWIEDHLAVGFTEGQYHDAEVATHL